eukprot:5583932-Pleurochrysis_carterae.AAC.2
MVPPVASSLGQQRRVTKKKGVADMTMSLLRCCCDTRVAPWRRTSLSLVWGDCAHGKGAVQQVGAAVTAAAGGHRLLAAAVAAAAPSAAGPSPCRSPRHRIRATRVRACGRALLKAATDDVGCKALQAARMRTLEFHRGRDPDVIDDFMNVKRDLASCYACSESPVVPFP